MSEDHDARPVFDTILDGGPLHVAIHLLIVGVSICVIFRAWAAYLRRTEFPLPRYVLLSFLPIVASSIGVYICLAFIWAVASSEGMADPRALPQGIISARLFLYSGWIGTTLSLLSVYAASRVERT